MNILALDLATTTGWALCNGGRIISGTKSFKNDRYSGGGMRFLRFERFLDELYGEPDFPWIGNLKNKVHTDIKEVVFEEVRRHVGVDAAHVYGGFMATLTSWCEKREIPYQGVPVGTIKKFIAGKGNASKQDVIQAVREKGHMPADDNEADALALLYYILENKGEGSHETSSCSNLHNHNSTL